MTSHGQVKFSKVRKMLKKCAPGHRLELKKHRFWVRHGEHIFRGLPKGPTGQGDFDIKVGIVKHMVRMLELDQKCVERVLPQVA